LVLDELPYGMMAANLKLQAVPLAGAAIDIRDFWKGNATWS
jgi:hypothetical protein